MKKLLLSAIVLVVVAISAVIALKPDSFDNTSPVIHASDEIFGILKTHLK